MIRRMFTFLLAIVFSFANVVFLHAAEANFWAERRKQFQDTLPKAEPMRLASLPSAPGALQTISNNLGSDAEVRDGVHSVLKSAANNNGWRRAGAGQTDPRLAALPLNQGRLVSYHPRPNKQAPLLALIQDVHLNTEAQGNIVQILSSLSGAHFKRTGRPIFVGVEAAFGPMDFSRLRAFDREAVAKPADEFLFSKNQLSAASFLGLQQEKEFAEFGGIDDKALYKRNVHAYLSSLKDRGDLKKILEEKKAENIRRKEEAFNPQLKEFDRFQRAHQSGAMDLGQYLTVLERFDPLLEDEVIGTGFELERFAQAYDLEKSLDFKRVERERNQVISLLAERLDQKDLEMLTARTMAFRSGGISYGDYFAGVKAMLASAGIRLDQTPAFDQYLRYLFLVDDLNAEALFASLAQKENALLKKLVRTPIEENLLEEGRAFLLTEKILDFALTPREWDEFRSLEQAGFAWADGRLKPFADFYVSADERSRVMADHLSERMKSRSADSAAVVVGGFHSPFLVRLMAERGVSTAVLQPNITKLEDGPGTVYLSVFSREKTPLDRLFKGEKLYLAPATLNIGQGAEVPAFINRAVISIEKNIPVPAEAGITVAADGGQINIIDSQNKFNAITLEQGEGDGAVETVFGVFHLKEGKARFGLDLLSFTVDALFHLIPAALLFLAPGLGLIPALAAGAVGFSALHLINKPASQNYTRRFLIQAGEAFAITAAGLFIAGFFSGEAFGQAAFNLASGDFFSLSSLVFLVAGTVLHAGFNPAAKAIPGLEPLNLNPPKKSLREILQPELWERLTALVKNSLPRGERWEDLNKENRTRLYGHVLPVFLEMYDKEVQAKADEGDYRLLKNKFSKIVFSAAEAYAVQEQEFAWLNEGVSFFDGASMTTRKSTPAEFAARMDTLNRILDGQIGAEDLRLSPEEALFELTGFQRRARRLQQAGQVTEVTLLVAPESQAADVLRVAQNSSQLTREKVDLLPPNLRQQGREQRAEFLLEESEDLSSSEKLDNAAEVYQLSAGSNDLKKDELRRRARALALEGLRGSRLSSEISDTSVAVFKNEDSSLGQRAAETKSAWRAAEHYLSSETVEDLDARVDDKQRALRFFRRELGIAAQFSAKEDSLRLTKAEQNLKKAREDGDLSGILNGLSEAKGLGPDDLLEIYLDVDRLINQAVASAGAVEDLAPLAALLEPWLNARRQSHPIEENLFPSWDPILDRVLDLAVWPEQINGFLHLFNGHRLHQEALLLRTIRPSAWKSSFENEFRQNPDLPLREIVRLIQREKTALLREIYRFGSIDDKGDLTASSTLEKDGDLIAGALKDWGSFLDRLKRENLTRVFGPSAEEERIAAFWNWQLVRWGAYNRFKQMLGRVLVDVDVWFSDIEEAFNDSSLEGDEKQENLQLAVVRVLNRIVKKDGKKKPESVHYNLKNKEGYPRKAVEPLIRAANALIKGESLQPVGEARAPPAQPAPVSFPPPAPKKQEQESEAETQSEKKPTFEEAKEDAPPAPVAADETETAESNKVNPLSRQTRVYVWAGSLAITAAMVAVTAWLAPDVIGTFFRSLDLRYISFTNGLGEAVNFITGTIVLSPSNVGFLIFGGRITYIGLRFGSVFLELAYRFIHAGLRRALGFSAAPPVKPKDKNDKTPPRPGTGVSYRVPPEFPGEINRTDGVEVDFFSTTGELRLAIQRRFSRNMDGDSYTLNPNLLDGLDRSQLFRVYNELDALSEKIYEARFQGKLNTFREKTLFGKLLSIPSHFIYFIRDFFFKTDLDRLDYRKWRRFVNFFESADQTRNYVETIIAQVKAEGPVTRRSVFRAWYAQNNISASGFAGYAKRRVWVTVIGMLGQFVLGFAFGAEALAASTAHPEIFSAGEGILGWLEGYLAAMQDELSFTFVAAATSVFSAGGLMAQQMIAQTRQAVVNAFVNPFQYRGPPLPENFGEFLNSIRPQAMDVGSLHESLTKLREGIEDPASQGLELDENTRRVALEIFSKAQALLDENEKRQSWKLGGFSRPEIVALSEAARKGIDLLQGKVNPDELSAAESRVEGYRTGLSSLPGLFSRVTWVSFARQFIRPRNVFGVFRSSFGMWFLGAEIALVVHAAGDVFAASAAPFGHAEEGRIAGVKTANLLEGEHDSAMSLMSDLSGFGGWIWEGFPRSEEGYEPLAAPRPGDKAEAPVIPPVKVDEEGTAIPVEEEGAGAPPDNQLQRTTWVPAWAFESAAAWGEFEAESRERAEAAAQRWDKPAELVQIPLDQSGLPIRTELDRGQPVALLNNGRSVPLSQLSFDPETQTYTPPAGQTFAYIQIDPQSRGTLQTKAGLPVLDRAGRTIPISGYRLLQDASAGTVEWRQDDGAVSEFHEKGKIQTPIHPATGFEVVFGEPLDLAEKAYATAERQLKASQNREALLNILTQENPRMAALLVDRETNEIIEEFQDFEDLPTDRRGRPDLVFWRSDPVHGRRTFDKAILPDLQEDEITLKGKDPNHVLIFTQKGAERSLEARRDSGLSRANMIGAVSVSVSPGAETSAAPNFLLGRNKLTGEVVAVPLLKGRNDVAGNWLMSEAGFDAQRIVPAMMGDAQSPGLTRYQNNRWEVVTNSDPDFEKAWAEFYMNGGRYVIHSNGNDIRYASVDPQRPFGVRLSEDLTTVRTMPLTNSEWSQILTNGPTYTDDNGRFVVGAVVGDDLVNNYDISPAHLRSVSRSGRAFLPNGDVLVKMTYQNGVFLQRIPIHQFRQMESRISVQDKQSGDVLVKHNLAYEIKDGEIKKTYEHPIEVKDMLYDPTLIYQLSSGQLVPAPQLTASAMSMFGDVQKIFRPDGTEIKVGSEWLRYKYLFGESLRNNDRQIETQPGGTNPEVVKLYTIINKGVPERYSAKHENELSTYLELLRREAIATGSEQAYRLFRESAEKRMYTGPGVTYFIKGTKWQREMQAAKEWVELTEAIQYEALFRSGQGGEIIIADGGKIRNMEVLFDRYREGWEDVAVLQAELNSLERGDPRRRVLDDKIDQARSDLREILREGRRLAAGFKPRTGAGIVAPFGPGYPYNPNVQREYMKESRKALLDETLSPEDREQTERFLESLAEANSYVDEKGHEHIVVPPFAAAEMRARILEREAAQNRAIHEAELKIHNGNQGAYHWTMKWEDGEMKMESIFVSVQEGEAKVLQRIQEVDRLIREEARKGPEANQDLLRRMRAEKAHAQNAGQIAYTDPQGVEHFWLVLDDDYKDGIAFQRVSGLNPLDPGESRILAKPLEEGLRERERHIAELRKQIKLTQDPQDKKNLLREIEWINKNDVWNEVAGAARHSWQLLFSEAAAKENEVLAKEQLEAAKLREASGGDYFYELKANGDIERIGHLPAEISEVKRDLIKARNTASKEYFDLKEQYHAKPSPALWARVQAKAEVVRDAERGMFEKNGKTFILKWSADNAEENRIGASKSQKKIHPNTQVVRDENNVVLGRVLVNGRYSTFTESRVLETTDNGLTVIENRVYQGGQLEPGITTFEADKGILKSKEWVVLNEDGQDVFSVSGRLIKGEFEPLWVTQNIFAPDSIRGDSPAASRTYQYMEGLDFDQYQNRPDLIRRTSSLISKDQRAEGWSETQILDPNGHTWTEIKDGQGYPREKVLWKATADGQVKPYRKIQFEFTAENPEDADEALLYAEARIPYRSRVINISEDAAEDKRVTGWSKIIQPYDKYLETGELTYELWDDLEKNKTWEILKNGKLVRKYALRPSGADASFDAPWEPYNVTFFVYQYGPEFHGHWGLADKAYTFATNAEGDLISLTREPIWDANGKLVRVEETAKPAKFEERPDGSIKGDYFEYTEIEDVNQSRVVYRISVRNGDQKDFEQFQEVKTPDGDRVEIHVGHKSGEKFVPEEITFNIFQYENGLGFIQKSRTYLVNFKGGDVLEAPLFPGFDPATAGEYVRGVENGVPYELVLKEESIFRDIDGETGVLTYDRAIFTYSKEDNTLRKKAHTVIVDSILRGDRVASFDVKRGSLSVAKYDRTKILSSAKVYERRAELPLVLQGDPKEGAPGPQEEEIERIEKKIRRNPHLPELDPQHYRVFHVKHMEGVNQDGEPIEVFTETRWVNVYGEAIVQVLDKTSDGNPGRFTAIKLEDHNNVNYPPQQTQYVDGAVSMDIRLKPVPGERSGDVSKSHFLYFYIDRSDTFVPPSKLKIKATFSDALGKTAEYDSSEKDFWTPDETFIHKPAEDDHVSIVADSLVKDKQFVFAVPVTDLVRQGLDVSKISSEVKLEINLEGTPAGVYRVSDVHRAGIAAHDAMALPNAGLVQSEEQDPVRGTLEPPQRGTIREKEMQFRHTTAHRQQKAVHDPTQDSEKGRAVTIRNANSTPLATIREYRFLDDVDSSMRVQRRLILFDSTGRDPIASVRYKVTGDGKITYNPDDIIPIFTEIKDGKKIVYERDPTTPFPYYPMRSEYDPGELSPEIPVEMNIGLAELPTPGDSSSLGSAANRVNNNLFNIAIRAWKGEVLMLDNHIPQERRVSQEEMKKLIESALARIDVEGVVEVDRHLDEIDASLRTDLQAAEQKAVPWSLDRVLPSGGLGLAAAAAFAASIVAFLAMLVSLVSTKKTDQANLNQGPDSPTLKDRIAGLLVYVPFILMGASSSVILMMTDWLSLSLWLILLSPIALIFYTVLRARANRAEQTRRLGEAKEAEESGLRLYDKDTMVEALTRFQNEVLEKKVRIGWEDGRPIFYSSDSHIEGGFLNNAFLVYVMTYAWKKGIEADPNQSIVDASAELQRIEKMLRGVGRFLNEEVGAGSDLGVARHYVRGKFNPFIWDQLELFFADLREDLRVGFEASRKENAEGKWTPTQAGFRDTIQRVLRKSVLSEGGRLQEFSERVKFSDEAGKDRSFTRNEFVFNTDGFRSFIKENRFQSVSALYINVGRYLPKILMAFWGVLGLRGASEFTLGSSVLVSSGVPILLALAAATLIINISTEKRAIQNRQIAPSGLGRLRAVLPLAGAALSGAMLASGLGDIGVSAAIVLFGGAVLFAMEGIGLLVGNRSTAGVSAYYYTRDPLDQGRVRTMVLMTAVFWGFILASWVLGATVFPWFVAKYDSGQFFKVGMALVVFVLRLPLLHHGINLFTRFVFSWLSPDFGAGETRKKAGPEPESNRLAVFNMGGEQHGSQILTRGQSVKDLTNLYLASFDKLWDKTPESFEPLQLIFNRMRLDKRLKKKDGTPLLTRDMLSDKAQLREALRDILTVMLTEEDRSEMTYYDPEQMYDQSMDEDLQFGQRLSISDKAKVEYAGQIIRHFTEILGNTTGREYSAYDSAVNWIQIAKALKRENENRIAQGLPPRQLTFVNGHNQYNNHAGEDANPFTQAVSPRTETAQRAKMAKLLVHLSRTDDGRAAAEAFVTGVHSVFGMKSSGMNGFLLINKLPEFRGMTIVDRNSSSLDGDKFIKEDLTRMWENPDLAIIVAQRNTTGLYDAIASGSFAIEGGHGQSMMSLNDIIGTGWMNTMRLAWLETVEAYGNPKSPFYSVSDGNGSFNQKFGIMGFTPNAIGISEDYWAVLQQYNNLMTLGYSPEVALSKSLAHKMRESENLGELKNAPPRWSSGLVQTMESLLNQQINEFGPNSFFEREARQTNADHYLLGPLILLDLYMLPLSVVFDWSPFTGISILFWIPGIFLNQITTLNSLLAYVRHQGLFQGVSTWLSKRVDDSQLFSHRTVRDSLAQFSGYRRPTFEFSLSGPGAGDPWFLIFPFIFRQDKTKDVQYIGSGESRVSIADNKIRVVLNDGSAYFEGDLGGGMTADNFTFKDDKTFPGAVMTVTGRNGVLRVETDRERKSRAPRVILDQELDALDNGWSQKLFLKDGTLLTASIEDNKFQIRAGSRVLGETEIESREFHGDGVEVALRQNSTGHKLSFKLTQNNIAVKTVDASNAEVSSEAIGFDKTWTQRVLTWERGRPRILKETSRVDQRNGGTGNLGGLKQHTLEIHSFFNTFMFGIGLIAVNAWALFFIEANNAVMMILSLWFAAGVSFGVMYLTGKKGRVVAKGWGDFSARWLGRSLGLVFLASFSWFLKGALMGDWFVGPLLLAGLVGVSVFVAGRLQTSYEQESGKEQFEADQDAALKAVRLAQWFRKGFYSAMMFFGWFVVAPIHAEIRFDLLPGLPMIFSPVQLFTFLGLGAALIGGVILFGILSGYFQMRSGDNEFLETKLIPALRFLPDRFAETFVLIADGALTFVTFGQVRDYFRGVKKSYYDYFFQGVGIRYNAVSLKLVGDPADPRDSGLLGVDANLDTEISGLLTLVHTFIHQKAYRMAHETLDRVDVLVRRLEQKREFSLLLRDYPRFNEVLSQERLQNREEEPTPFEKELISLSRRFVETQLTGDFGAAENALRSLTMKLPLVPGAAGFWRVFGLTPAQAGRVEGVLLAALGVGLLASGWSLFAAAALVFGGMTLVHGVSGVLGLNPPDTFFGRALQAASASVTALSSLILLPLAAGLAQEPLSASFFVAAAGAIASGAVLHGALNDWISKALDSRRLKQIDPALPALRARAAALHRAAYRLSEQEAEKDLIQLLGSAGPVGLVGYGEGAVSLDPSYPLAPSLTVDAAASRLDRFAEGLYWAWARHQGRTAQFIAIDQTAPIDREIRAAYVAKGSDYGEVSAEVNNFLRADLSRDRNPAIERVVILKEDHRSFYLTLREAFPAVTFMFEGDLASPDEVRSRLLTNEADQLKALTLLIPEGSNVSPSLLQSLETLKADPALADYITAFVVDELLQTWALETPMAEFGHMMLFRRLIMTQA